VDRPRDERGATAVEYAILGSMIAAVIALTVTALGLRTLDLFVRVVNLWP
jgi:Flp pilus assembly pilin Flp